MVRMALVFFFFLGIGLFASGMLWILADSVLDNFIMDFVVDSASPYFVFNQLVWDSLPYVLFIVGLVMFMVSGLANRRQG